MSTNEQNEQSELQKKLDKVTPEQLRNISVGQLFATGAAVRHLVDLLRKDKTAEPLQDVEKRQAIKLLPLTILTSSQLDAKGKKLHGVALGDSPALDPSSRDYNPAAYKDTLQELAPQITEAAELLRQYTSDTMQIMLDTVTSALLENLQTGELLKVATNMRDTFTSKLTAELGEDESKELLPYIMQALNSPKYEEIDEDNEAELWQQLIQEARQLRAAQFKEAFNLKAIKNHSVIKSRELALPFDVFNEAQNSARQVNGQIKMLEVAADHKKPVGAGKEKRYKTEKITSYFGLTFEDTLPPEIIRIIDFYDELLYGGLDACMQTNGNLLSFHELYHAMGYKRKPDDSEKEELIERMRKMESAFVYFDFSQEQQAYKGSDYSNIGTSWREGTALLHFKIMRNIVINGQPAEDCILILDDELPLFRAARKRNYQLADVAIEAFQLPGKMNRNNENLAIVFFVLRQVDRMKDPKDTKTKHAIDYGTIYEKCGLPAKGGNKDKRKTVKKNFLKYLDHLVKIKHIAGWREKREDEPGEPGVKIFCTDAELKADKQIL